MTDRTGSCLAEGKGAGRTIVRIVIECVVAALVLAGTGAVLVWFAATAAERKTEVEEEQ